MADFCHMQRGACRITFLLPVSDQRRSRMSVQENTAIVRRSYDELWNERKLEVADEVIAAEGSVNYDTGLVPLPFGPEDMKGTVKMVTAAFPDNHHEVEEMIA